MYFIDQVGPLRPPPAEISAWAADKRVFVSSVMAGMDDHRKAAAEAITTVGATPVMFETFGGREDPPGAAYLSEVGRSEIYAGVLDVPYGRLQATGRSATHDEYQEAERLGLSVSVWATTKTAEPRQADFLKEVRQLHTTGTYSTVDELRKGIEGRLVEIASEELSPWVKLGRAVFRARSVHETGSELVIQGAVRNQSVLAELRGFRGGLPRLGSGWTVASYGGRSLRVAVQDFRETTRPGLSRDIELSLRVLGTPQHPLMNASLVEGGTTLTPVDLAEIAIRRAVNDLDLASDQPHFMSDIGRPWSGVEAHGLPEDSIGPVAGLLLTEALVGSGTASALTRFRLGPQRGNHRHLKLAWSSVARYQGEDPEIRSIECRAAWPPPA